ncbi:MAG: hypothetical protein NVSMB3_15630 [Acidobacteriaceae bacterium]
MLPSLYGIDTFAVAKDGIFFLTPKRNLEGAAELSVLRNKRLTPVAVIDTPLSMGLSVSSDERSVLYSQVDQRGSDLILLEPFQ